MKQSNRKFHLCPALRDGTIYGVHVAEPVFEAFSTVDPAPEYGEDSVQVTNVDITRCKWCHGLLMNVWEYVTGPDALEEHPTHWQNPDKDVL